MVQTRARGPRIPGRDNISPFAPRPFAATERGGREAASFPDALPVRRSSVPSILPVHPEPLKLKQSDEGAGLSERTAEPVAVKPGRALGGTLLQRKIGFELEMSIPVSPTEKLTEEEVAQGLPEWWYATRPVTEKTLLIPKGHNPNFYAVTDHDAILSEALGNPQPNIEIVTTPIDELADDWQEQLGARAKAIKDYAAFIMSKDPKNKRSIYPPRPELKIGYPAEAGFDEGMEAAREKVSPAAFVQATLGIRTEALPGLFAQEGTSAEIFGDLPSRLVNAHAAKASQEIHDKLIQGNLVPSARAKGVHTAYQSLSADAQAKLTGLFALIDSYLIGGILNHQETLGKNIVGLLAKTDLAEIRKVTLGAEASDFVKNSDNAATLAFLLLEAAQRKVQEAALALGFQPAKGNPPPADFVLSILLGRATGDLFTEPNVHDLIPAEKVGPGAEEDRATGGVFELRAIPGQHDPGTWDALMLSFAQLARKLNTPT